VHESVCGTFETSRAGLEMSVVRGGPEVAEPRSNVTRLTLMYGPAVRCKKISASWR